MPQDHRKIAAAFIAVCAWAVAGDAAAARRRPVSVRARSVASTSNARSASASEEMLRIPTSTKTTVPSVLFVTEKRAYLNRGALDGLVPGQSISLLRRARGVGPCTIESVSDHRATCIGAHAQAGDGFRLPVATVEGRRALPPVGLPPVEDAQTLRERALVVGDAEYQKVDFNHAHASASHVRASLQPAFALWHTASDPGGDYSLERLDGAVQAYDIGGTGLDFAAAFTAMHWGARASSGRFRPTSQSQFYLWEAQLSRRHTEAQTVVTVGRMWPWHTPGLAMLDGLQIGRRNQTDTAEGGIYAGMLPVALSTMPSSSSWAAGSYGTLVQTGSNKGTLRLMREEVRVGVLSDPVSKLVTDADLVAQAWIGMWNVSLGGRALLAPHVRSGPQIDRASFDLGARPTAGVGANLHLRYLGAPLPATVTLAGQIPTTRGLLSAFADTFWNISAGFALKAFGSFNQERDTNQRIVTAGAEARLPRVGDGLSLGGEVETGWMRGVLGYSQLAARAGERIQLLARLSVSASQFQTSGSASSLDEVGGYLHVEGRLATWLRLRAWSLLRVPFLIDGELPRDPSYGLVLGASLTGVN
jgi:hypothetical protein